MPASQRVATVVTVDPASELGLRVLRSYWEDIVGRYWERPATPGEIEMVLRDEPSDDLVPPSGLFVAAVAGGEPAGCGGLRFHAHGIAELTRIHVAPGFRRRGIGALIVRHLEGEAAGRGRTVMRLDVRGDLTEARAMYARLGYLEVPAFNDHPWVEHWFEKRLNPPKGV